MGAWRSEQRLKRAIGRRAGGGGEGGGGGGDCSHLKNKREKRRKGTFTVSGSPGRHLEKGKCAVTFA